MKHLYGWTIVHAIVQGNGVYIKAESYKGGFNHWQRVLNGRRFSWNGEWYEMASVKQGETSFRKV